MNIIEKCIKLIKKAGYLAQWYLGTALSPIKYESILEYKTKTGKLILENKMFMGEYLYDKLLRNLTNIFIIFL